MLRQAIMAAFIGTAATGALAADDMAQDMDHESMRSDNTLNPEFEDPAEGDSTGGDSAQFSDNAVVPTQPTYEGGAYESGTEGPPEGRMASADDPQDEDDWS